MHPSLLAIDGSAHAYVTYNDSVANLFQYIYKKLFSQSLTDQAARHTNMYDGSKDTV
jgi:hypothetical protein